jgi:hypothetical protein
MGAVVGLIVLVVAGYVSYFTETLRAFSRRWR